VPTTRRGGRLQSFPTRMPIAVELVAEILGRVMAHNAIRTRKGNRVEICMGWMEREVESGRSQQMNSVV